MKKIVLLFSFLTVVVSMVYAQTSAPQVTRISVNEKGEVELEWTRNVDENDFDHSEVWYKNEYQDEWEKINSSESTSPSSFYFKHNAAQANTRRTSYFVVNYDSDLNSFRSAEVSPIYSMACFRDGNFEITWNRINENWKDDMFYVYRRGVSELWELIHSTDTLSYKDISNIGDYAYSYRVSYMPIDDEPTASISNVTDPITRTDHQPKSPIISSLLIHADGTLSLNWEKTSTNNVTSYDIYLAKNTGGWELVAYIDSPDILTWSDKTPNDYCTTTKRYSVAAKSVCGETSPDYPDFAKTNVRFSPISYNPCDSAVWLSWLAYTDMPVDAYEIYASYDSLKSFIMIDEVGPEVFSYEYKATTTLTCYFQIRAVHYSSESTKEMASSCIRSVDFIFSERPEPTHFRYASVKGTDIEVCFEVDSLKPYLRYRLERSSSSDGVYTTIADTTDLATTTFCHTDLNMNVQNVSYHYQLKTIDTCDGVTPAIKPIQSILLQAELAEDGTAQLEWTAYDGFINGLDGYMLYRYVNGELNQTFWPLSVNYFTDIDPAVSDITMNIEYLVKAVSIVNENETGDPDEAYSNRAQLRLKLSDVITFPNAFAPSGVNNVFKPTIDPSINMSVYRLVIYNRWGEMIFETNRPREGWNGLIKGKMAPTGGYAYFLRIVTDTEDAYERRGSFILIN